MEEDEMDKLERQYSKCVDIVSYYREVAGADVDRFFADLFLAKQKMQPRLKDAFYDHFENNWQPRHYGREMARVADKVYKQVESAERAQRSSIDDSAIKGMYSKASSP
mmetsp:Transcript_11702/g.15887  ORF Transcript_11702/g.15887 Transcript_11702/m.15887 type:complete len:108 (+) Transcript_11702:873-1196(+)|eukprot:CAMPEP_0185572968 /NCGR_PEP_ID=MMETSP0434-20130131/4807_1 /TAXON_ID=626734 ORGANISM="Favella taraikaensis, Strain Fe Narragansett Bay" /NCGR_SAMPLE_ID=MMETSP0434 /ASSEMBLY_ACC=CAM_ASM_000379 /LENGTH=107 /DNA_ID=CAMNT_0028189051 /DNA_START=772 /DNA_END=1095 /DNA_ORIENTATION=+